MNSTLGSVVPLAMFEYQTPGAATTLFPASQPCHSSLLPLSPLLEPRLPSRTSSGELSASKAAFLMWDLRVLGLPHLTLPFILTSWAFLLFSTEMVVRPEKLSTPEEHLAEHKKNRSEMLVFDVLLFITKIMIIKGSISGGKRWCWGRWCVSPPLSLSCLLQLGIVAAFLI